MILHLPMPFHSQSLRQLFLHFAFPPKHGIEHAFLPPHIQVCDLASCFTGRRNRNQSISTPSCQQSWPASAPMWSTLPYSHCWICLAPKYGELLICVLDPCTSFLLKNIPRICLLNISTSSGFFFSFSQLSYSHHYSNNIFLILKKNHPLTHTPCNYCSKHLLFFT